MSNISSNTLRLLELARRISSRSDYPQYKIGAVVARKGQVIGVGYNRHKTHPKSPNYYKYLHAEVDATLNVPLTELKGATIYVHRTRKDGLLGMAKPCPTCHEYLRSLGIKTAYFTTEDGYVKIDMRGCNFPSTNF